MSAVNVTNVVLEGMTLNIVDAVEKRDLKALKQLVEAGANVNAMHGEWTALMLAAANRDIEAVLYLLRKGADPNLKFRGPAPHLTALGFAAGYGYSDVAKILIDHGADVNVKDDDGTTLLMHIMVRRATPEVVRLLLENRADPHVVAPNGVTALMVAEYKGHKEVSNVLRDHCESRNGAAMEKVRQLFVARDYDACVLAGLELIATQPVQHEVLQFTLISLLRCKGRGPWITPHFKSNGTNAFIAESIASVLIENAGDAWESALLGLTIGKTEFSEVLKRADSARRRCQAHYYCGARLMSIGRAKDASAYFKAALEQKAACIEREIAESELDAALKSAGSGR